MYIYIYKHIYIYIHTHTHIHIYIYIYNIYMARSKRRVPSLCSRDSSTCKKARSRINTYEQALVSLKLNKTIGAEVCSPMAVIIEGG